MKKTVYLIHGWDGNPKEPMHKWIGKNVKEKGFEFFALEMPNPKKPEINSWINKIKSSVKNLDKHTIFIGHSVGCQAVLRYLETLKNERASKIILIAPWMHLDETTIKEEGEEIKKIARPWMETPIDWKKIKIHCKNFVCIFSNNDPYVPLSDIKFFKEKLNAKTILLKDRGHFDPSSGIKSLPEILKFLK